MFKFNWIDLFFIILLIRIGYISSKNDLYAEILKFIATLTSLVLGLHFLPGAGRLLTTCLYLPNWLAKELAILVIFFIAFLIFFSIRIFLTQIMTAKFNSQVDRTGALVLGLLRAVLTFSMILVMLDILPNNYVAQSIWGKSYSAPKIIKVVPSIYRYVFRYEPNRVVSNILNDGGE
ncbi:MAG: CvpA family protein [Candidatus Omnitrophota bacterium]